MIVDEALAWADQTMNDRLREARRTGTDGDYDAAQEACIDALAAEVRRLREDNHDLLWNLGGCNTYADGYDLDGEPSPELARPALLAVLKLARSERALRERHAAAVAQAKHDREVLESYRGAFTTMKERAERAEQRHAEAVEAAAIAAIRWARSYAEVKHLAEDEMVFAWLASAAKTKCAS